MPLRQTEASGLEAVRLATELLHRVRLADPYGGIWEAADVQWWWRTPRASDELDQPFWLDGQGPVAAVLVTAWTDHWGLDPIVAPGAPPAILAKLLSAVVDRLHALAPGSVEALVRDDDEALARLVGSLGFKPTGERGGATWVDASDRPTVPPLLEGFELVDRVRSHDRPHPLVVRNGPTVEARLNELALYDPALDLAIRATSGEIAAYGLFWFDPVTRVGLVEPMRTEAAWQRRGLARTLLAAGLDRLARRGATRLKVGFGSEPARNLYLGVGFRVQAEMTTYSMDARGPGWRDPRS
jgi:ribosomal protein S18 acetylase RimI-like enzyme